MVLIDTNPLFWSSTAAPLSFSKFLSQVLSFVNSVLLLNQLNQVMVIATGLNSCDYIYDSSSGPQPRCSKPCCRNWKILWLKMKSLIKMTRLTGSGHPCFPDLFRWHSVVPIDSCVIGSQHSAFLQQASYITGGVYLKPQQPDGLFQYLTTVFATDLHSRSYLHLPKPVGVDFRAS
ncbi:putative TFIIH subunit Tfb4/GTF2H3, von Willebrand factor A-like domain superfamily [Helianthus annuus]|nr:putative TFIIH subunit Tfb4/GTF2H3, von Willebrand factor A-like domain superfamily [Helianthus annuus]